jgi:DNA-binding CsgD family transcriptional regulator
MHQLESRSAFAAIPRSWDIPTGRLIGRGWGCSFKRDLTMASERDRGRCKDRLQRLSRSALDRESIQYEAITELRRAIGFNRWCWPVADPDSLIPLGAVAEHDFGPQVPVVLALEFAGGDVGSLDTLARRANPVSSLEAETGGDLARSRRWDEVFRCVGIGDEALVACRDRLGCWGWIEIWRDSNDRPFDERDLQLLAVVGPSLGSALRRTSYPPLVGIPTSRPPAVIVLDSELRVISLTAGARDWIETFPSAEIYAAFGILPAMVYPAATLAQSPTQANRAHALERTRDGTWVMIEAATLEGSADGQIAVTFREATAQETFDRLCRISALSRREREVVAALLEGLDTRATCERLFISPHTLQDHLKSVFDKLQIHSRRELRAIFDASLSQREQSAAEF